MPDATDEVGKAPVVENDPYLDMGAGELIDMMSALGMDIRLGSFKHGSMIGVVHIYIYT